MKPVTIKLQIDFPVVKLSGLAIKHSRVAKISLPKYMLILFIDSYSNYDGLLIDSLKEAGITGDMLDLFSDELYDLLLDNRRQYIEHLLSPDEISDALTFRKRFRTIQNGELQLTEKYGKRLLREQFILDGDMGVIRKDLFYNPVSHSYRLNLTGVGPSDIIRAKDFAFETNYPNEDNIVDYLNSVRKDLKLQEQEEVVGVENIDASVLFQKNSINIILEDSGAAFVSDSPNHIEYLTRYYKSVWLEDMIKAKVGEWSFNVPEKEVNHTLESANIILPNQLSNAIVTHNSIVISDGLLPGINTGKVNYMKIGPEASAILSELGLDGNLLIIKDKECKLYKAVRLSVTAIGENGLGFKISVLLEESIGEKEYERISNGLVTILKGLLRGGNLEEDIQIVKALTVMTGRDDLLVDLIDKSTDGKDVGEKVDIFLKLNQEFAKLEPWKILLFDHIRELEEEELSIISFDNLKYRIKDLKALEPFIKVPDKHILDCIVKNLPEGYDRIKLFKELEKTGLDEIEVLKICGFIPSYVQKLIDNEPITDDNVVAEKFKECGTHLSHLRNLVGIDNDPVDFTLKEIKNREDFQQRVKQLIGSYNKIESCYAELAPEGFARLKKYYGAIRAVSRLISDKPVSEYSKQDFIKLADTYPDVCIIRLHTRAEIELRKLLGLPESSSVPAKEMISTALEKGQISQEDSMMLSRLRQIRNKESHQGDNKEENSIDWPAWIDVVMKLNKAK